MPEYNIREEGEMQVFFHVFSYFFSFLRACKNPAFSGRERKNELLKIYKKEMTFLCASTNSFQPRRKNLEMG
jgi:hypothetical protein